MRWPWVSSARFRLVCQNYRETYERYVAAMVRVQALEKQLDVVESLRRDEQWRRIKAEGLCAFKDERMRRVLGLPGFADNDEEKKAC